MHVLTAPCSFPLSQVRSFSFLSTLRHLADESSTLDHLVGWSSPMNNPCWPPRTWRTLYPTVGPILTYTLQATPAQASRGVEVRGVIINGNGYIMATLDPHHICNFGGFSGSLRLPGDQPAWQLTVQSKHAESTITRQKPPPQKTVS
jgi:hypothetical protein